jgi:hypothetical protein
MARLERRICGVTVKCGGQVNAGSEARTIPRVISRMCRELGMCRCLVAGSDCDIIRRAVGRSVVGGVVGFFVR